MLRLVYCICGFCLLLVGSLAAQQVPVFQQSAFMPQLDNPARYGEGFVGLNYRQQWTDLGDAAPTSLRMQFDASSLLGAERVGLGFGFVSDQAHIVKRNQLGLSFAYALIPENDHHLALGVQAAYLSQRLSFSDKTTLNDGADLALLQGEASQGVIDGGLGIFYQFNVANEHIYSLDVSLPQLFASDLNYELDAGTALTELLPHLLTRFSYRYQASSFSIEPIGIYRHFLGGKQGKTASIDATLRFGFLQDRFWAAVGSRFGASTVHFSFGIQPLKNNDLQISASLETHQQLGQSFEFGVLYPMGERQHKNDRRISQVKTSLDLILQSGQEKIQEGKASLTGISPQTNEIVRRERLAFAKTKLAEAQTEAKNFRKKNMELKNIPGADMDETVTTAFSDHEKLLESYYQALYEYEKQIRDVENYSSLATLIDEQKDQALKTELQAALDKTEDLPETMEEVEVIRKSDELHLVYTFSNDEEAYLLNDRSLSAVDRLIDHVNDNIEQLKGASIEIKNIQLRAKMYSSPQRWKLFNAGTYNAEYGRLPAINWEKTNTETNTTSQETITILEGDIKLEKLVALKLFGMGRQVQQRHPNSIISYFIEGPSVQDSGQYYEIKIIIGE